MWATLQNVPLFGRKERVATDKREDIPFVKEGITKPSTKISSPASAWTSQTWFMERDSGTY